MNRTHLSTCGNRIHNYILERTWWYKCNYHTIDTSFPYGSANCHLKIYWKGKEDYTADNDDYGKNVAYIAGEEWTSCLLSKFVSNNCYVAKTISLYHQCIIINRNLIINTMEIICFINKLIHSRLFIKIVISSLHFHLTTGLAHNLRNPQEKLILHQAY